MKYSDIKVSPVETKIISIDNQEITVKQEISTNDLYDLIMITLQEAKENCIYNPFKLDVFFHVNLIMMITDIEFTSEEKMDKFDIYNKLTKSGLLVEILESFPIGNYKYIREVIEATVNKLEEYENRAVALISKIITDLPANAEAAAKIVDEFDPEKFQKVIDFATAANGGRPIGSN